MTASETPAEQILKMCAEMVELRGKATAPKKQWLACYEFGHNPAPTGIFHRTKGKEIHQLLRFDFAKGADAEFIAHAANHASQMARALASLVESVTNIIKVDGREDTFDNGDVIYLNREDLLWEALTEAVATMKEGL